MAYPTDITQPAETYPLAPVTKTDDPDLIRRQIDYTRVQLGSTINAIGERLSPDNLIQQAKSSAREATVGRIKDMTNEANRKVEGVSTSLGQTVRENPLPVALIGLGLGWLWMSSRNKTYEYPDNRFVYRSQGYYPEYDENGRLIEAREWVEDAAQAAERKANQVKHRAGEVAENVSETVSGVAHRAGEAVQNLGEAVTDTTHRAGESATRTINRAGETISEATDTVQERVGETAERARHEAERLRRKAQWRSQMAVNRTKRGFWDSLEENPLVVGAVVAMAGAAVGASIPATEYENQLLGQTRDRLLDEAKVRAQDAVERVQAVVEDTQRAVVSEAKESAQRHNLSVDNVVLSEDHKNNDAF